MLSKEERKRQAVLSLSQQEEQDRYDKKQIDDRNAAIGEGLGNLANSNASSIEGGALSGAAAGAPLGGIGAGVGGVLGGVLGGIASRQKRKEAQRQFEVERNTALAQVEANKSARIQAAIADMGNRMSRALQVPTLMV